MLRAAMNAPGKIVFVCTACAYRARIPEHYQGMSIKCPGCGVAQVAEPAPEPVGAKAAEAGTSSVKTVSITRVATTPLPFTMDQAGSPADANGSGPNPLRTPLPGALAVVEPAKTQVTFVCTACGFRARVPRTYAGKTIACPKCAAPQVVPADAPATGVFAKPLAQASANTVSMTPIATPALAETSALFATPPAPMAVPPRIATPVPTRFPTPRPELRAAPIPTRPDPVAVAAPISFDLTSDSAPAPMATEELDVSAVTSAPAPAASAPAKGGAVKRRYVVPPTPAPVAAASKAASTPTPVAAPVAVNSGNRGLLAAVLVVLVVLLALVGYLAVQLKEVKNQLAQQRNDNERNAQAATKAAIMAAADKDLATKELGGAQAEIANLRGRLDEQMRKIAELETKLADATAPMRAPATKMESPPTIEPSPMGQPPVVTPKPKSEL